MARRKIFLRLNTQFNIAFKIKINLVCLLSAKFSGAPETMLYDRLKGALLPLWETLH
jgi:hypothetical protein